MIRSTWNKLGSKFRLLANKETYFKRPKYEVWCFTDIRCYCLFNTDSKSELKIMMDLNGLKIGKRYYIRKTERSYWASIELEKI